MPSVVCPRCHTKNPTNHSVDPYAVACYKCQYKLEAPGGALNDLIRLLSSISFAVNVIAWITLIGFVFSLIGCVTIVAQGGR